MATTVTVSTLAGNQTIAVVGDTVQDVLNDDRVTGYDSSKIVRVNNETAELTDTVPEGAIVSFASPDYKHGA